MDWDDNRRKYRDRGWDRYADPRGDEHPYRAGDDPRGRDDEPRDPGLRDRMRQWGDRARDVMDRDDDRSDRGRERVFAPRVTYEDWRRTAGRGHGLRGRSEDWRDERDRGGWHAEPTRHPDAARRWAERDGDREEGWFAREREDRGGWGGEGSWNREDRQRWARELGEEDRSWRRGRDEGQWNTRSGGWSEGHRGDAPAYGTHYGLSDVPRWNGRDFRPRHDEDRTEWRDDRPRTHDSDDRGFFARMKDRMTGRAPRNYRRSDERIREDVCDRLMQSWIDAEDVDVQVRDGEVTLTGTVRMRDEKRALEDLVEGVLGVKDVDNHVKVRREGDVRTGGTGTANAGMAAAAGAGVNAGMGFGQALTPDTQGPGRDVRSHSHRDDGGVARTPEGTSASPPNGTTRRS